MDFRDTDKIIRKVNDCLYFLKIGSRDPLGNPVSGIFNQGVILRDKWPELYNTLVDITNSTAAEDEKQKQRHLAFAANYKKPGDIEFGKEMLTYEFNEQGCLDFLKQNEYVYDRSLLETMEAEFWRNYQLVTDIGLLCNLYRERWIGNLYEIDVEYFSLDNVLYSPTTENTHELYTNVKALRDCGLLKAKDVDFEVKFRYVAAKMNFLVSGVVEFFTKMRRSTIDTKDLPDNQQTVENVRDWNNKNTASVERNHFNRMAIEDVRAYFTPLFDTPVKGQKLLPDEYQNEFINRCFLNKTPVGGKMMFTTGAPKRSVVEIFHKYYSECKDKYEISPNCSSKYKSLLEDNFLGYEKITNFRS